MQYRTSSMAEDVFYTFWFEKNLQGDIVAVYNSAGIKVISYSYDAWGNCITKHHNLTGTNSYATFNPFRYRGYYFDSELGFYYLNSRYYNPIIGRFLNADVYVSTGQGLLGYNMFAYCNNSPIIYIDPFGEDTIYVCSFKDLEVVGHAFLLIQDENGVWYYTDYGYYADETVQTFSLEDYSNDPYEYLKAKHIETKTITKKYLFGLITITKTYTVNAYTSLYIEGDFSEALELAKEYQETGYGEYKVLSTIAYIMHKTCLKMGNALAIQCKKPYLILMGSCRPYTFPICFHIECVR